MGYLEGSRIVYVDEQTPWTLSGKIGQETILECHDTLVKMRVASLSTPNGDLNFTLKICRVVSCTSQDAMIILRYIASRSPRVSLNESILLESTCPLPLIRGIRTPDMLLDLALDS
jgi:hypothetical protein